MTNLTSALGFIESQMAQIQYPVTGASKSVIAAGEAYAAGWTGAVSGTFDLIGVSYATVQPCPIVVTSPSGGVPGSYNGVVTGHLTNGMTSGTILAFTLVAGTEELQSPQCAIHSDGTFALNLAGADQPAGAWNFMAMNTKLVQQGSFWPSPATYENLEVQSYSITDTEYLTATQPASSANTFSFPSSEPGRKMFTLYDTSLEQYIAVYVPLTGNVRSYSITAGQPNYGTSLAYQSYQYDQAMCLLAAIAMNEPAIAQQLAAGLLAFQTAGGQNDGGFIFSGPQLSPSYGDPAYRTGSHAIGAYALLSYLDYAPGDDSRDYQGAAVSALDWLGTQLIQDGPAAGLYLGGNGTYTGTPPVLKAGAPILWAATEHQLDIWHAYVLAAEVLAEPSWLSQASALETAILAGLWDGSQFYQGSDPSGTTMVPDTGNPLDGHSWGAIWAQDAGRPDIASKILNSTALAPFLLTQEYGGHSVTGYQPEYASDPSGDYPGATPTIWAEGTYGTAVAYQHLGNSAEAAVIIAAIDPLQNSDGSFPYVTVYDPVYDLTPSKAVIGPAWAILAGTPGSVWNLSLAKIGGTARARHS
jgi:hypothetical protein